MEKRVLIVDDNKDFADTLALILGTHGYTCEVSSQPIMQLLEAYRKPDSLPRVIISDFKMPGKNGLEFVRDLKAHPVLATIKVIIISGYDDAIEEAQAAGLEAFPKTGDVQDTMKLLEALEHLFPSD